jgi:hypothetical protein
VIHDDLSDSQRVFQHAFHFENIVDKVNISANDSLRQQRVVHE